MGKQRELFNRYALGTSPKKRKKQVDKNIRVTIRRLETCRAETEEEKEMAEEGGQEYWSTFRR